MSVVRYRREGFVVCQKSNKYKNVYRDLWVVKATPGHGGVIRHVEDILCPPSLFGKRVRIRIEIVDDILGEDQDEVG